MFCSKSANSRHAARYLKRAVSMAQKIRGKAGKEWALIDGCLLQASKASSVRKAQVLELPGAIIKAVMNYRAEMSHAIPGQAETSTMETVEQGGATISKTADIAKGAAVITIELGTPAHYTSLHNRKEIVQIFSETHIQAMTDSWARTINGINTFAYYAELSAGGYITQIAARLHGRDGKYLIRADINQLLAATGYSVSQPDLPPHARSIAAIQLSQTEFVIIFNAAKIIHNTAGLPETFNIRDEKLFRLNITFEPNGVFEYSVHQFPESILPPEFTASTVTYERGDTKAQIPVGSAMRIYDLEVAEDKSVQCAIRYDSKRDDESADPRYRFYDDFTMGEEWYRTKFGTTISAIGIANWADARPASFDIKHKDVFGGSFDINIPNSNVSLLGADPDRAAIIDRVMMNNGKLLMFALMVERRRIGATVLPYIPYEVATMVDGQQVVMTGDKCDDYRRTGLGFDVHHGNEGYHINDTYLYGIARAAKARVSDTTIAFAASGEAVITEDEIWGETVETEGKGIAFWDGQRFKFEPFPFAMAEPWQRPVTVTCCQEEVRNDNGELIKTAVVICQTFHNGEEKVLIRRGAIWPEDAQEPYSFSGNWEVIEPAKSETEGDNTATAFYFYVGNPYLSKPLNRVFT